MPQMIFPAPDHDHGRCASAALAHAEALCAERAQRLTPMRRHVLQALLASHRPLGAYEIIERLADPGRPAPITVYRALDFLRDNGLVHRIESRNAFVACVHNTPTTTSSCSFSASAVVRSARRRAARLRKPSRPRPARSVSRQKAR